MNHQLVLRAANFAAGKHRDQKRKDAGASPYINHPITVALILSAVGGVDDEAILAAALLHDTIEDTETTADELQDAFGAAVRGYVEEVSDDKQLMKEARKRKQIEHANELSPGAAIIKLGDKIANVLDVTHNPPAGWTRARRLEYLDWAQQVVRNLPRVNPALEDRFHQVLEQGREHMGRESE